MSEYIVQSERVARMGDSIESLKDLVDEIVPIVEAACDYVDLQQEAHHVPVSTERKIRVKAALYNAVINYRESKL